MNFLIYPHDTQECKLQMESREYERSVIWEPAPLDKDARYPLIRNNFRFQWAASSAHHWHSDASFFCLKGDSSARTALLSQLSKENQNWLPSSRNARPDLQLTRYLGNEIDATTDSGTPRLRIFISGELLSSFVESFTGSRVLWSSGDCFIEESLIICRESGRCCVCSRAADFIRNSSFSKFEYPVSGWIRISDWWIRVL